MTFHESINKHEALEYHRSNPLDVVSFSSSRIGLNMPRLFPRQADFLTTVFPAPSDRDAPIFNPEIDEGVALWGKGAGKDTIAAIAQLYVVYRLMLHDDPQRWIGLAPTTNIDLVNVAYNAQQAEMVFFELVKTRIARSPFFPLLDGFDPRRDVRSDFIRFPHQVLAHSLHAQSEAVEGKNLFFGVMDEADAFLDASKRANADGMHKTLRTSQRTRFKKPGLQGIVLILSWPRHQESFTIRRYAKSQVEGSRVFGSRGATWDIRTDTKREDFAQEYADDPEGTRAKLETLPPATEDAFFKRPEKITAAFRGRSVVTSEPYLIDRGGRTYTAVDITDVEPGGEGWWVHGDAGLSNDSYAIAMARVDGERRIVGALILWEPRQDAPVDFLNVAQTFLDLRENFDVVGVSLDQWNSAETSQRLLAAGMRCEVLSFSQPQQLTMYEALKRNAYNDLLELPPLDGRAATKLHRELTRLQLLRGRKVDHPQGESKDVADAVAAACWMAREAIASGGDAGDAIAPDRPSVFHERGAGGFNRDLMRSGWTRGVDDDV